MAGLLIAAATTPTTAPTFVLQLPSHSGTHWAAVLTTLFAGAAAFGAAFAGISVREAKRARLATTASDLFDKWNEDGLVTARKAVVATGSPGQLATAFMNALNTSDDAYYVLVREVNFYENLGLLVKSDRTRIMRRSAYLRLIQGFLGSVIVNRYDYWLPAILRLREHEKRSNANRPGLGPKRWYRRRKKSDLAFCEFEALANRLRPRLQMERPSYTDAGVNALVARLREETRESAETSRNQQRR